jgi:hypothetical protein
MLGLAVRLVGGGSGDVQPGAHELRRVDGTWVFAVRTYEIAVDEGPL